MAVTTSLTKQLNIQHPIMLAGMGRTSGAPLAAAVSNAGGLGVIGGVSLTEGYDCPPPSERCCWE